MTKENDVIKELIRIKMVLYKYIDHEDDDDKCKILSDVIDSTTELIDLLNGQKPDILYPFDTRYI